MSFTGSLSSFIQSFNYYLSRILWNQALVPSARTQKMEVQILYLKESSKVTKAILIYDLILNIYILYVTMVVAQQQRSYIVCLRPCM